MTTIDEGDDSDERWETKRVQDEDDLGSKKDTMRGCQGEEWHCVWALRKLFKLIWRWTLKTIFKNIVIIYNIVTAFFKRFCKTVINSAS